MKFLLDMCCWKGQLKKREVGKFEVGKSEGWKVPSEIGKFH